MQISFFANCMTILIVPELAHEMQKLKLNFNKFKLSPSLFFLYPETAQTVVGERGRLTQGYRSDSS